MMTISPFGKANIDHTELNVAALRTEAAEAGLTFRLVETNQATVASFIGSMLLVAGVALGSLGNDKVTAAPAAHKVSTTSYSPTLAFTPKGPVA